MTVTIKSTVKLGNFDAGELWTVQNFHFEQHFMPPEEQAGGEHGS